VFPFTVCMLVNSIWRGNYWGSSVWILTQQVNYRSYILHSSNSLEKMGIQGTVLFIDVKKASDSVRSSPLAESKYYNILIEFGIPLKPLRLIKMCLTEVYSRVWVDNLSDMFPIRNDLKQGMLYCHSFQLCFRVSH
jgi:hypothetical protein